LTEGGSLSVELESEWVVRLPATQITLVPTAIGGSVVAIVEELASGGDNAMIYEGCAAP
jgi:hypothetical protein